MITAKRRIGAKRVTSAPHMIEKKKARIRFRIVEPRILLFVIPTDDANTT
jgi:hypothetical protein